MVVRKPARIVHIIGAFDGGKDHAWWGGEIGRRLRKMPENIKAQPDIKLS